MLFMSSGSEVFPPVQVSDAHAAPHIHPAGKPLAGRHIALTWSVEQGEILTSALEAAGARVVPLFAGAAEPVGDTSALDAALLRLECYDRIVLTSLAGVDALAHRLAALGLGPDVCHHIYIAMLFPVTARARELAVLPPQLVPPTVLANDIAMGLRDIVGKRLLLLCADHMHDTVAPALRLRGAKVDEVSAYRMSAHPVDTRSLERILTPRRVDAIICTSDAMAEGLLLGLSQVSQEPHAALRAIPLITLDTAAAAPLRRAGLTPTIAAAATATGDAAAFPLEALVAAVASVPSTEPHAAKESPPQAHNEGVFLT
ncbi:MAG: uroporphyrinogen-III synthase [Ktedonobacterales bacterium]